MFQDTTALTIDRARLPTPLPGCSSSPTTTNQSTCSAVNGVAATSVRALVAWSSTQHIQFAVGHNVRHMYIPCRTLLNIGAQSILLLYRKGSVVVCVAMNKKHYYFEMYRRFGCLLLGWISHIVSSTHESTTLLVQHTVQPLCLFNTRTSHFVTSEHGPATCLVQHTDQPSC